MTFIISEDAALKEILKGMTVADDKNPARPVGVWYGLPDNEIREQSYPFVTINLIDIGEETDRVMNGTTNEEYLRPEGVTDDAWEMWFPIPMFLEYQITTFTRNPRHDREILQQLLGYRLPVRFGALNCDGIARRLDVRDIQRRQYIENTKRVFMNVFTIRVSSEILTRFDYVQYTKVSTVVTNMSVYDGPFAPWPGDQREPLEDEVDISVVDTVDPFNDPSYTKTITITPHVAP